MGQGEYIGGSREIYSWGKENILVELGAHIWWGRENTLVSWEHIFGGAGRIHWCPGSIYLVGRGEYIAGRENILVGRENILVGLEGYIDGPGRIYWWGTENILVG